MEAVPSICLLFQSSMAIEFAGPSGQRLPEQVQMDNPQISLGPPSPGFRVSCDAGETGKFQAETDSLWVRVAQRIRRRGTEEMWDSVAIESTAEPDGTLVLRVIVFNPDWDEPLQIASIRSRPRDLDSLTPLGCNLDHVVF
jgi:hypothetical protein